MTADDNHDYDLPPTDIVCKECGSDNLRTYERGTTTATVPFHTDELGAIVPDWGNRAYTGFDWTDVETDTMGAECGDCWADVWTEDTEANYEDLLCTAAEYRRKQGIIPTDTTTTRTTWAPA